MKFIVALGLTAVVAFALPACKTTEQKAEQKQAKAEKKQTKQDEERAKLAKDVQDTVANLKQTDPSLDKFFKDSYGYAVFPTIIKGGLVVGGAGGKGEVYEKGRMVGWSSLSQGSIGLQIGGQGYSELIFFQTKQAFDNFTKSEFAFAGQVSGVAVKAGAAQSAAYANGVAIFTMPKGGLMGEASIGGQEFKFERKS